MEMLTLNNSVTISKSPGNDSDDTICRSCSGRYSSTLVAVLAHQCIILKYTLMNSLSCCCKDVLRNSYLAHVTGKGHRRPRKLRGNPATRQIGVQVKHIPPLNVPYSQSRLASLTESKTSCNTCSDPRPPTTSKAD